MSLRVDGKLTRRDLEVDIDSQKLTSGSIYQSVPCKRIQDLHVNQCSLITVCTGDLEA